MPRGSWPPWKRPPLPLPPYKPPGSHHRLPSLTLKYSPCSEVGKALPDPAFPSAALISPFFQSEHLAGPTLLFLTLSSSLLHCNLTSIPFPTPNCSSKVLLPTGSFSILFRLLCPLQNPAGPPNHPVPRLPTSFNGTEHQPGPRERRNRIIGSSKDPTPIPRRMLSYYLGILFAQGRCGSVQLAVPDPPWSAIILLYGPFNPTFLSRKSQNQVESQASSEQSDLQPHVGASFPRGSQHSLAYRLEDEGIRRKLLGKSEKSHHWLLGGSETRTGSGRGNTAN